MIVCILTAWTALSVALGLAIGKALALADADLPDETDDDDLLADVPAECLSDAEIRRRCDRIEAELRHPSGRSWLL